MFHSFIRCLVALCLLPITAIQLHGQQQDDPPIVTATPMTPAYPWFTSLITIGSPAEDSLRLDQLLGRASTAGFLIREPWILTPPLPASELSPVRVQMLNPEARWVYNSDIPFSINQGALWAGRGANLLAMFGMRIGGGPVVLTLAPEVAHQQNLDFQTIPPGTDELNVFASPWHTRPESLDQPQRFGDRSFRTVFLGQSSLVIRNEQLAGGISTANQWWGPGQNTALVLSNNAPGIPHAFVRTASPFRTRFGALEAKYMLGLLRESEYFDDDPENDHRSISGIALTFQPRLEPDLSIGFARTVYAPIARPGKLPTRLLDAFGKVGQPNDRPLQDPEAEPGPDQIFSLFGRWVFPDNGAEIYAEWARSEAPRSLRDFLEAPHHTQGYTLGLQWARPAFRDGIVRIQGEGSFLEASTSFRYRRVIGFYKSRPVPQGYAHHGRVIGAATSTGSSSQWLATDYIRPTWQIGLNAGRIRWDNDAFFAVQDGFLPADHDVTVFGGLRGGVRLKHLETTAVLEYGTRMNFLFQNPTWDLAAPQGVDIRNYTFTLRVQPRLSGR
jgi:hypothetical protein